MIDPRANPAGIATHVIEGPVFCWFDLGVGVKWPALTD
jgi:hypothetical protein